MGTGNGMRGLWLAGASLAVLMGASPALADAAAAAPNAEPSVVQTLVVTAQRREEAIQDVPVAVSAFSADSLTKQNISGGQDLLKAIPNVNFARGNFSGYNFQIRGIGTKSVGTSADGGISVHENDVPQIVNALGDADFFDVERVEVLRGPQGTLFGRNATGGVVNVISNKPTDRYQGELTADYGNYDAKRLKGFVNIPFGDTFAVRAAGTYLKRDGFATNTYYNTSEDGRDLYSGRLTAQWKPNDHFRTYLMWETFHENDDRDRVGKQLCIHDPGPAAVGGVATSALTRNNLTQGCANGSLYGSNAYGATNTSASLAGQFANLSAVGLSNGDLNANTTTPTDWRQWQSKVKPIYQSTGNLFTLNSEWDLTNAITVTNQLSYSQGHYYTRTDYNRSIATGNFNTSFNLPAIAGIVGAPVTAGVVNDPQTGVNSTLATVDQSTNHNRQLTEELRFQTSFNGPWNFSGGVNFVDFNETSDYYVISNGLTVPAEAINLGSILQGGAALISPMNFSPSPDGPFSANYYDNRQQYRLRSYSAFGEANYKINDDLKLTLGLRGNEDRKWLIAFPPVLYTPLLGAPSTPFPQTVQFSELTGRARVEWTPHLSFTDKTMVYVSYSRGYKPGGFNPGITPGLSVPPSFNPEFVNAGEIGTKNVLLGGSLVLNATGFFYDYKGYQISAIVNRTSVNSNVDAQVYGAEFEAIWEPVTHLRLNGTLGLLHTEVKNGATPDQLNLTAGDPTLTFVKAIGASNCVAKTQDVATIQTLINYATSTPTTVAGATAKAYAGAVVGKGLNSLFSDPSYFMTCNGILGLTAADTAGSSLSQVLAGLGLPQFTGFGTSSGINVNLNGKELPNSPNITANIGAQYTWNLSNGWRIIPRADAYYQGESYARVFNTDHDLIRAYDVENISVQFEQPDWKLSIQAYVKNVFDKNYIQDQYLTDASSGLYTNIFIGDPRTYGLAVTKKF